MWTHDKFDPFNDNKDNAGAPTRTRRMRSIQSAQRLFRGMKTTP